MLRWKIIGILATLTIVLSLPLYVLQQQKVKPTSGIAPATFVGSEACARCHKKEYEEWQQSHHARSMAVATDATVLGDFNDAVFEKDGVRSRFFRKEGGFFVHTRGVDGEMADFQISHTFGCYPLQQYLVPFPDGRLQCLPIAWDVQEKKWFHLYPDLVLDPGEWIYWTNQGQNWNSMCADCHSTELQKNYDPQTGGYNTRWAEISVGCEACHGPGSRHLAWASLPEMARSGENYALLVRTSPLSNRQQVELCAPCHSRRTMLGDYRHEQQDLLDTELPRLLEEGLYFPDGQIRDEVYVYGSFVQSKMHAHGVGCSDCHNPHTITLHKKGNALCLQCHQAVQYDTRKHHFHRQEGEAGNAILDAEGKVLFKVGSGAQCVQCHMPGRMYMINDYRPDHSIRIPRPDLSVQLNTPNACNRCHIDKSNEWSAEYTKKWYGIKQKYQFGTTFAAGRKGEPRALSGLLRLVDDPLSPVLVRATALSLLGRYQSEEVTSAFKKALASEEPLLRWTGCAFFPGYLQSRLAEMIAPLAEDPVKAVRIEAARTLMAIPPEQIAPSWRKAFEDALAEFKQTSLYSADFAASRLNLGAMYSSLGEMEKAEEQWKKAVEIDRDFFTARTNLAVLYSRQGKNDLAEQQLRKALEINPELPDVHYSLGLLLSEQKQYREAVQHLQKAADGMVSSARAYYNLGRLLDFLHQEKEAETAFRKTLEIAPRNMQYLQTMARFYMARKEFSRAKDIARQMIIADPANPLGRQLLDLLSSGVQQ